ncbi:unnamed protein product, partial [Amoebophrya sp. A120]|eukprot:GSA120T00005301001.1
MSGPRTTIGAGGYEKPEEDTSISAIKRKSILGAEFSGVLEADEGAENDVLDPELPRASPVNSASVLATTSQ